MFELILQAPQPLVDPLSDALIEQAGALSVSVEDADAGGHDERPLYGEPGLAAQPSAWPRSTLRALFEAESHATSAAALLLAQDWAAPVRLVTIGPVADADWVRLTQSQFEPVAVTPSLWVVPSWHSVPPQASTVIRLDPGLAFGTGTHPTTRMCLRWIASNAVAHSPGWHRVLDYGCGSGILAIAAALHGARHVDAVDVDAAAIETTRFNAQANHVSLRAGPPQLARGTYALVLANILATPLKLLAPLLSSHVGRGGHLVLAGILERQADELRDAYAQWLNLDVSDREDGWALMTAGRG